MTYKYTLLCLLLALHYKYNYSLETTNVSVTGAHHEEVVTPYVEAVVSFITTEGNINRKSECN